MSRRRALGFTQVEALAAALIFALTGGGIAALAKGKDEDALQHSTRVARVLLAGAGEWMDEHAGACPSASQLGQGNDAVEARPEDAWGSVFRIVCREGSVSVVSAGPDQKWQTSDDVTVSAERAPTQQSAN